jgi:hypothetical protein
LFSAKSEVSEFFHLIRETREAKFLCFSQNWNLRNKPNRETNKNFACFAVALNKKHNIRKTLAKMTQQNGRVCFAQETFPRNNVD